MLRRRHALWAPTLVGLSLVTAGCATGDANLASSPSRPSATTTTTTTTATGTAAPSGATCTEPPATPAAAPTSFASAPPAATAKGKTVLATIRTNCGDIVLELDGTKAPQTVASFMQLAGSGYWKDSPCHRLTAGGLSVLQCGDPTGQGNGNPGYGYGVENAPADGAYPVGTVAMARTADPNSNGGQFFIVTADSRIPDPTGYSIFGKVVGGQDVLKKVTDAGVRGGGQDGPPAQPISILSASVKEK